MAAKGRRENDKRDLGGHEAASCVGNGVRLGRPTTYDPSYCDQVVALGSQGYSKAMMAAELGVVRQTLDNWADTHPEFLDAITRAHEFALAWWEKQGLSGIWSRDFNANAYRLQMMNRFPDEWRDTVTVEDGHLRVNWKLVAAQPGGQAMIARIAAGEDWRIVLDGVLEQLRQSGILSSDVPKRLGPGR